MMLGPEKTENKLQARQEEMKRTRRLTGWNIWTLIEGLVHFGDK